MSRIYYKSTANKDVALCKNSHNYNYSFVVVIGSCTLDDHDNIIIDRTMPYNIAYYDNIREANNAYNYALAH